jgi:hypothetical protein
MKQSLLKSTQSSLILAVAAMLLFPKEAWVSKIFYDTMPLSRLIDRSSLIVVAQGIEPFQKTERKKIKKGEPYSWNVYAFKIISVVWKDSWQDSSYLKKDSLIYVSTFDESDFDAYRDYYESGISVSFRVDRYDSPTQPPDFVKESKTNGILLFLKAESDRPKYFRFTASHAFESINKVSEIKELTGNTGSNRPDDTAHADKQ